MGTPVDILRLHGCSIGCEFCDEVDDSEAVDYTPGLYHRFRQGSRRQLLLTGGEPLQQLELNPGSRLLTDIADEVECGRLPAIHVETSGHGRWSSLRFLFDYRVPYHITISPKRAHIDVETAVFVTRRASSLCVKYLWVGDEFYATCPEALHRLVATSGKNVCVVVQPTYQELAKWDSFSEWYAENYEKVMKRLRKEPTYDIIKDSIGGLRFLPQLHKL